MRLQGNLKFIESLDISVNLAPDANYFIYVVVFNPAYIYPAGGNLLHNKHYKFPPIGEEVVTCVTF